MKARAALPLICAVAVGCNPQPGKTAAAPSATPAAAGRGTWLHITQSGTPQRPLHIVQQVGNRRQYDLIARSSMSAGTQFSMIGTFVDTRTIFFGQGHRTLTATAPRAVVNQSQNSITLLDGVHARTESGMTLACDWLRYDQKTQLLHGEGHVAISGPHGVRATGTSFDSDIALSRAVIR